MIVHGGGRQLDAGFVVVSHLHPLREYEVARDQHAAHAHRAAAEQQKQDGQQNAKRALSAFSGAARVLLRIGGARLHAPGHVFVVRQRALIAGIGRVAVVIDRRVRVVVVISQRVLVRGVAEITVFILGRRVLSIRPGIGGLLLLLPAADGRAVPAVSGGKIVRFRNGTDNLRLLNGAEDAVGLLTHLADALFAVLAAFFQVFQLVGQLGAVKLLRVEAGFLFRRVRLGLAPFVLFVKRRDFKRRFFLVQGFFPRGGAFRDIRQRRAALGAFGQIGCVPCAALGAFH